MGIKISGPQLIVLEAIRTTIIKTGLVFVNQDLISVNMPCGKLPQPNSLDALVKNGYLETNKDVSWDEYRLI